MTIFIAWMSGAAVDVLALPADVGEALMAMHAEYGASVEAARR